MSTFGDTLRQIGPKDRFDGLLAEAAAATQGDHCLYPNEVEPATRLVRAMRQGARGILLAHPMQSGKTNIMRAATHILRALLPQLRAIYICANDQLDLRRQNRLALAPHVELLNRSERRKMEAREVSDPTIVFYDESHFGDGADMTIQQFLERQGLLDQPLAVFCGVSATPMTSLGCLDATVWADMPGLEAAGYNSPRLMLERGRLKRAQPMFDTPSRRDLGGRSPEAADVTILADNPALVDLEERLGRARRDGYVLIRAHRWEAAALRAYLEGKWGARVYVVDWNQHSREFSPDQFFSQRNFGVVTVVLVQHKARMGTVIDTKHCHFMYEYRRQQRGMTVDTIAQSFLGRACGFQKQDHGAVVYTRPDVARAYTLLMGRADGGTSFARFCESHALKPASRAHISRAPATYALEACEVFEASPKDPAHRIRRRCEAIRLAYALAPGMGAVRTLSRTADPLKAGLIDVSGRPRRAFAEAHCGTEPGSWSMVIFDRRTAGGRTGEGVLSRGIVLAIRGTTPVAGPPCIEPTQASMHYDLRARRRRTGQLSFSFDRPIAAMAAAAR